MRAIICLGRGPKDYESERDIYDRVLTAVRIYRQKGGVIVFTGGYTTSPRISEAKYMMDLATTMGVPREDIIIEEEAMNTVENAILTKEIIETMNVDEVFIVTSVYHIPRSAIIFNEVFKGYTINYVPSPYRAGVVNLILRLAYELPRIIRKVILGVKI